MPITDCSTPEALCFKVDESSLLHNEARELRHLFVERLAAGPRDLLLKVPELKYMDSTGVATLLFIIQTLKKQGKTLKIERPRGELVKLFQTLQLDQYLVLVP